MTDDDRLGPPPIEPLSDAAWARVERGVWAQLDAEGQAASAPRSPRRWWLAAVPLAAAAAVAMLVLAIRERPATLPDDPPRVVSGTAPSAVSFGDAHIELDAETALTMNREAEHPTVRLERGAAWFTVAHRLQRPAFLVHAGDATVRVVGTRFRVGRSDEQITVEVDRGLVDVQFRGSAVALAAGQRWSSDAPSQISQISTITAAAPPPPAEPVTAPVVAPEAPDPAPAAPAPARRHDPRPAKPAVTTAAPHEPKPDPAPAETGGDRDRAEYDRLAALEPRSPDAALTGYLALARGTSRWADPALFAAARLAVDRRDRRAEGLLGIYLQRFPDGANATDARQLLARLKSAP